MMNWLCRNRKSEASVTQQPINILYSCRRQRLIIEFLFLLLSFFGSVQKSLYISLFFLLNLWTVDLWTDSVSAAQLSVCLSLSLYESTTNEKQMQSLKMWYDQLVITETVCSISMCSLPFCYHNNVRSKPYGLRVCDLSSCCGLNFREESKKKAEFRS